MYTAAVLLTSAAVLPACMRSPAGQIRASDCVKACGVKRKAEMNRELEKILEGYRDEMVEKLQEFIRIESVAVSKGAECTQETPFGKGSAAALEFMMELGREKGFATRNYDNMVCELDFGERKDEAVGTIGHADVVPAAGVWEYPPFGGEIHGGRIYGRGAMDDKGPTLAAFYAVLAIKESGLPLSKNITQIIGGHEEGGYFPCLRHYIENAERIPAHGIVPDSYFPICFSEKHFAGLQFTAGERRQLLPVSESAGAREAEAVSDGAGIAGVSGIAGTAGVSGTAGTHVHAGITDVAGKAGTAGRKLILKSITGGDALNIVPPWAEAVFCDEDGNVVRTIRESGVAAHASMPEQGENAIAKLLRKLAQMEFEPADICEAVKELPKLMCRDTNGRGIGIAVSDVTGETTNNVALIKYSDGRLSIISNARLPLSLNCREMEKRIARALEGSMWSCRTTGFMEGFYINPEDEPAKTLINVYREESGDTKSQPFANGCGSYARLLPGFIPFGMAQQGGSLPFHVENEYIEIEEFLETAKIYAEALYRMAK